MFTTFCVECQNGQKCDITQNIVNFLRHILPYLSFLIKDIITKRIVQVRLCQLQAKSRKQNSLNIYNSLRYKFVRHILPYCFFPLL